MSKGPFRPIYCSDRLMLEGFARMLHIGRGEVVGPGNGPRLSSNERGPPLAYPTRIGGSMKSLRKHLPRLIYEQDQRCGICGDRLPIDYNAIDVDHVVPKSKGGHSRLSNLQAAHAACNARKWNREVSNALVKQSVPTELLDEVVSLARFVQQRGHLDQYDDLVTPGQVLELALRDLYDALVRKLGP